MELFASADLVTDTERFPIDAIGLARRRIEVNAALEAARRSDPTDKERYRAVILAALHESKLLCMHTVLIADGSASFVHLPSLDGRRTHRTGCTEMRQAQ